MTALAVWLGINLGRARNERLAAETIKDAAGKVVYDWQAKGLPKPPQPTWLRRTLGPHFFDRIVRVELRHDHSPGYLGFAPFREVITPLREVIRRLEPLSELRGLSLRSVDLDANDYRVVGRLRRLERLDIGGEMKFDKQAAAAVARITSLRTLWLTEASVSPEAAEEIGKLHRLEELRIGSPSFISSPSAGHQSTVATPLLNDAAVIALSNCRSLRSLQLFGTEITDKGAAALRRLLDLDFLVIESPHLTGKTLHELKRLKKLAWLDAWRWRIADEDLAALSEMPSLVRLGLYTSPRPTDDTLRRLAGLERLKTLRFGSNRISGAGLTPLRGMTDLEELDLSGSQVDKLSEAAKQLQAALPGCKIQLPPTFAEREAERDAAFRSWLRQTRSVPTRQANPPPTE